MTTEALIECSFRTWEMKGLKSPSAPKKHEYQLQSKESRADRLPHTSTQWHNGWEDYVSPLPHPSSNYSPHWLAYRSWFQGKPRNRSGPQARPAELLQPVVRCGGLAHVMLTAWTFYCAEWLLLGRRKAAHKGHSLSHCLAPSTARPQGYGLQPFAAPPASSWNNPLRPPALTHVAIGLIKYKCGSYSGCFCPEASIQTYCWLRPLVHY